MVSFCTGAYLLAGAGLLDGRPATTLWTHAERFRARFPQVQLNPGVLYIDDGEVLTSAGNSAAADLALHIVRRDPGVGNAAYRQTFRSPPRQRPRSRPSAPQPAPGTVPLSRTGAWRLNRPPRSGRRRAVQSNPPRVLASAFGLSNSRRVRDSG
jgi:transcriptional regulator GlxA family with amidase domain